MLYIFALQACKKIKKKPSSKNFTTRIILWRLQMLYVFALQACKQLLTSEEVRRDMWRDPASEQLKNKEAATRVDIDLHITEEIQVNSCPKKVTIQRGNSFVTHIMNLKPPNALYFALLDYTQLQIKEGWPQGLALCSIFHEKIMSDKMK